MQRATSNSTSPQTTASATLKDPHPPPTLHAARNIKLYLPSNHSVSNTERPPSLAARNIKLYLPLNHTASATLQDPLPRSAQHQTLPPLKPHSVSNTARPLPAARNIKLYLALDNAALPTCHVIIYLTPICEIHPGISTILYM